MRCHKTVGFYRKRCVSVVSSKEKESSWKRSKKSYTSICLKG